ncbi:malate dehydrogenase, cytoplasmic-like [Syzygium oleosum]|uniref:malate dehydrogenase, cytoplasmic-like n=1 Tax=Syzygium oleosum TaxID=219896 RepID=UPI0024B884FA|nr:malate dehydrogenase, cytoplasmic-like [Syzygium oleosum]
MLGRDQPVILHMLDGPSDAKRMNEAKMELMDCRFPLLEGAVATTDVEEACKGVSFAVVIGGFPRKEGMETKDVIAEVVPIYKFLATALEKHAAADCKIFVVANPANTIPLILKEFAPSIPEKNTACSTKLYHNRATGIIAHRLHVPGRDLKNVIVWGSDSLSRYLDVNHATVNTPFGEKPVRELIKDDAWLDGELVTRFHQIDLSNGWVYHQLDATGWMSAYFTGWAASDHIHDWVLGTPNGTSVSMGVCSDGSSNVPAGLFYSFPVTCCNGEWTIVQGLPIDEFSRKKTDLAAEELIKERAFAYSCLLPSSIENFSLEG